MPLPASLHHRRQELRASQTHWASRVQALQADLAWERDPALRAELTSQLAEAQFEEKLIAAQLAGLEGLDDAALASLPQLPADPKPYCGLLPFDRARARFFFGRDRDRQRLLERLSQRDFVALTGAAGSGKTSLIQAGLLPDLAGDRLPGSSLWQVISMRPGSRPLAQLARELIPLLPAAQREAILPDLHRRLSERSDSLLSILQAYLPGRPFLLIVDPLDDLFGRGQEQAAQFVSLLTQAARQSDGQIRVLVALASQHLAPCLAFPQLPDLLEAGQLLLGPLDEAGLREAIIRPAQLVGAAFEAGLAGALLREALAGPAPLGQLQQALHELWLARRGPFLTLEAYRAIGGLAGALPFRAQALYDALPEDQKTLARLLFLRLAQAPAGWLPPAAILAEQANPQRLSAVARAFSEAGLLLASEDAIELAQPLLLAGWPALDQWLAEDQEWRRIHGGLAEAAGRWHAQGRPDSLLYRGAILEEVERWAEQHRDALAPLTRDFLQTSLLVRNKAVADERAQRQRQIEIAQRQAREAETRRQRDQRIAGEQMALAEAAIRKARQRTILAAVLALFALAAGGLVAWQWQSFLQAGSARQMAQATAAAALWAPQTAEAEAQRAINLAATSEAAAQASADVAATWQARAAANADLAATRATESAQNLAEAQRQARRAQAASLASLAQAALARGEDPTGSLPLLLASQAVGETWQPDGLALPAASQSLLAAIQAAPPWRMTLASHEGAIFSAAFSADGARIVSAGADRTARLWDATTGEELARISGQQAAVNFASFDPSGRRIAAAGADGVIRIWQLQGETLRLAATLRGHDGPAFSALFNAAGTRLISAGQDGVARIWDSRSGRQLRQLTGHQGALRFAAFNPAGDRAASAGMDGAIRLWETASGQELQVLTGHAGPVNGLAFSPDGQRVASAGQDGTLRVWSVVQGRELLRLTDGEALNSAFFSPDGGRLAAAGANGVILVWDAVSGQELLHLTGHEGAVNFAAFDPAGERIVSAGKDGALRLWDAWPDRRLLVLRGHGGWVISAAFDPAGERIVTAAWDRTARIWDAASGQELLQLAGHRDAVNAAAFDPTGGRVVTASSDRTARVWNAASGEVLLVLTGHSSRMTSAVFSSDGRRILTAAWDGTLRLWDGVSGEERLKLDAGQGRLLAAAFDPAGDRIVSAGEDGTAKIWDASSGAELLTLAGHTAEVNSAAFDPAGKRVVTAGDDGLAWVWDAQTGQELLALTGHGAAVNDAAFSPDGRWIVTAAGDLQRNTAADYTIRIWDAVTGVELLRLSGHDDRALSASFSPDGLRVVTASSDRTARLWPATGEGLIALAETLIQRDPAELSAAERRLIGEE